MSAGYSIVSLFDIINEYGEDKAKIILSNFSCPYNLDVETFLRTKSIEFEKQDWAKTKLVYASYRKKNVLVGYFSISSKTIVVTRDKVSKTLGKRISKFAKIDSELNTYTLSAPLIGQLGKNFENKYNKLIKGDELLKFACDTIKEAQQLIGGRFTYLECEDKPVLTEFYEKNGFVKFDKRKLENDEKTSQSGTHLIQMLKHLK